MPATVIVCSADPALVARVRGDLDAKGFTVELVSDGDSAWKLAHDKRIDLVIADINAPGIDGFQLCRLFQIEAPKVLHRIPVILVSPAYRDEMVTRLARAVGAWMCIQGSLEAVNLAGLATEAIGRSAQAADADAPRGGRGWLVIGEDDPDIAKMLNLHLTRQGFEVVVGTDGEETERLVKEMEPDLLITDYQLPKKNGLEVVKWARAARPQMAIIMVTAHSSPELLVELVRTGVDDFLAKPFDVTAIAPLVEIALRKASIRNIDLQFRAMTLELLQVHQQVVRTQRMAAIGEVGLAVRHEVNNPLTALMGQAEMLLHRRGDLPEDVKKRLTTIHEMAVRIRDIVKQLEDIKEDRTKTYIGTVRMTDLGKM